MEDTVNSTQMTLANGSEPGLTYRILVLGERWSGSGPSACAASLSALGHSVFDCDSPSIFPTWKSRPLRAGLRLIANRLTDEYNQRIITLCQRTVPDLALVLKGNNLQPTTLGMLRELGIRLYNYYPDTSLYSHGSELPLTIPYYDCVFFTKRFQAGVVREKWGARDAQHLPHGYDPQIHRPITVPADVKRKLGASVVFTAVHTDYKEQLLSRLVQKIPTLDLKIYGAVWPRACRGTALEKFIIDWQPRGAAYADVLNSATINLAIMSGKVHGSAQGDETTRRTFEIPACRAFMLHERTAELAETFREGEEVACFGDADELVHQISYYLGHEELRLRMANAAYNRCVPAYSMDARMRTILAYHTNGRQARSAQAGR